MVTTNVINYFFGSLNGLTGAALFSAEASDPAITFLLAGATHLALTRYTSRGATVAKRFATLTLSNLFVFLLAFAFSGAAVVQSILLILLIGLSSLLFGRQQKKSLLFWCSLSFSLLVYFAIIESGLYSGVPMPVWLQLALSLSGAIAIVIGLGSTVVKVRQIEAVLDSLLEADGKEGQGSSSLSASSLELIKNNITEKAEVYKLLATHSKDIILLFSTENTVSYISPAVENILGYAPEEAVGKSIFDFVDADMLGSIDRAESHDFPVKSKKGNLIWLEANFQKIYNEQGTHFQTQAILRDITEHRWLNEVLKQTTEIARIGGWETDVTSRRTTYTNSLVQLLGLEGSYIPSKEAALSNFTEESAQKLSAAYDDVFKSHRGFDLEAELTPNAGIATWVRAVIKPTVVNGQLVKVVGNLMDISERKKNEETLKELAMIARHSSSATIITNKQQEIEWVNEAFCSMTGYSLDEIKGKTPGSVLQGPESSPEVRQEMRERLRRGESFRGEIINYHKSGEAYWVEININPVFGESGEVIKYIAIENDISERKATEWQLQAAKKSAEEASIAKERFLSTMTHEIRTPLNAVIGMSQILMDEGPRADQMDLLKPLHYSAENLLALINDILDFTKMSSETIEFENLPFRFNEEFEKAVGAMKFKAAERGNTISYEGDTSIPSLLEGDLHRLTQVLNNLIGNATKFTENGFIKVTARAVRQEHKKLWVRCSVADNGIGLSKDKLETIFEKFSQADSSISRKYGGTGLGLAICKMIVEQQGGRIWAESSGKGGATFHFEVPLKTTTTNEKNNQAMTTHLESLDHIRVLTVDDNQINQLVLDRFLKKWHVSFKQASNGKEAIELASQERFDIILMDLEMPVIDGYSASLEIRAKSRFNAQTPIIALTASTRKEVEGRVFEAGMCDVVMKPFNPMALHQVIIDHTMSSKALEHVA